MTVDIELGYMPMPKYAKKILAKCKKSLNYYYCRTFKMDTIDKKWLKDQQFLPLTEAHRELYRTIHILCWVELGYFPNLVSGISFNDKIQWLKLFNQDKALPNCTDKLLLKEYVKSILGANYVPKTYQACDNFDELELDNLPSLFVLKTNHDSGSVFIISRKSERLEQKVRRKITKALKKTYGEYGGEWPYKFINKKVYAEEYLYYEDDRLPPDYKFHCSNGKVLWLQYISDRGANTKETIVDRNGNVIKTRFDQNMTSLFEFSKPSNWNILIDTAEQLSKKFKYVRVDLYSIGNRVYVGEMTFFPLMGCYKSDGNIFLGSMMNFDRNTFLPPFLGKPIIE